MVSYERMERCCQGYRHEKRLDLIWPTSAQKEEKVLCLQ